MNKLYKRTTTGAIQQYEIVVSGNTFWTIVGKEGGKLITSMPTLCEGKNIGKANETSPEEQAQLEAKAKWQKKIDKGYTENINAIDTAKKYFDPMLAKKYLEYKEHIPFPVLVSPKIDGCRMIAQKNGLFTRNGKPYSSCPHISKALKPFFDKHPDWIIDGEIYAHDESFEKVVSLVKKSKPTAEDLVESEKLIKLWIFDGDMENEEWNFVNRFKLIKEEIKKLADMKYLKFVENKEANNHDEVQAAHDNYVREGFEGVMVRIPNSFYENKRSKNLLKLKEFCDEEFVIKEVVEGSGNRSGMAGKLIVTDKNGNEFGAGIKGGEDYYKQLLKDKNKLIGKLATIRYQNLSEDGIPRFPVAINIDPVDR